MLLLLLLFSKQTVKKEGKKAKKNPNIFQNLASHIYGINLSFLSKWIWDYFQKWPIAKVKKSATIFNWLIEFFEFTWDFGRRSESLSLAWKRMCTHRASTAFESPLDELKCNWFQITNKYRNSTWKEEEKKHRNVFILKRINRIHQCLLQDSVNVILTAIESNIFLSSYIRV